MKSIFCLSAVAAMAAAGMASPASASTLYMWCEVGGSAPRGMRVPQVYRYHSGIIEIPNGPDARNPSVLENSDFAKRFVEYVRGQHRGDKVVLRGCSAHETLLDARKWESTEVGTHVYVHTGWLGNQRQAVDRGPVVKRPPEDLILAFPKSDAGSDEPAAPRKKSNAVADAEYAEKLKLYEQEMAAWRAKVAERDRLEAEGKRQLAESVERAKRARAEWERRVAACKAGDIRGCGGAREE